MKHKITTNELVRLRQAMEELIRIRDAENCCSCGKRSETGIREPLPAQYHYATCSRYRAWLILSYD